LDSGPGRLAAHRIAGVLLPTPKPAVLPQKKAPRELPPSPPSLGSLLRAPRWNPHRPNAASSGALLSCGRIAVLQDGWRQTGGGRQRVDNRGGAAGQRRASDPVCAL